MKEKCFSNGVSSVVLLIAILPCFADAFLSMPLKQKHLKGHHLPNALYQDKENDKSKSKSSILHVSRDLEGGKMEEEEEDWRSFRAKLVSNEQLSGDVERVKASSSISWIYDAGTNIERGTLLLNNPSEWSYNNDYALSKQYLHKSVIIVLEHDRSASENGVTTGILLNRPTDLLLGESTPETYDEYDEYANKDQWNIWFGGHDYGLHTCQPKFYCLHSLTHCADAIDISDKVMEGLYFCPLQDARKLVKEGMAYPHDFWSFSGVVTWNTRNLIKEVQQGSWHAAAMDGTSILDGLNRILRNENMLSTGEEGDQIWTDFMQSMEKSGTSNTVSDEMLGEWCKQNLIFDAPPTFLQDNNEEKEETYFEMMIKPGMMVRSSPSPIDHKAPSQFLLTEQHFHKSTILILQHDDEITVGAMLNMPSSKTIDVHFQEQSSIFSDESIVQLPLRYGGPLGGICVTDQGHYLGGDDHEPMLCLHMNEILRNNRIGEPIGMEDDVGGIWKCSMDAAREAIGSGIALAQDFIVVDGICVWMNEEDESEEGSVVYGGLSKDIGDGKFELVSEDEMKIKQIWKNLIAQEVLNPTTLEHNIAQSGEAWASGAVNDYDSEWALGVVDDYDSESLSESLHDRALRRWMQTFLIF